jgi:hypothetical protein
VRYSAPAQRAGLRHPWRNLICRLGRGRKGRPVSPLLVPCHDFPTSAPPPPSGDVPGAFFALSNGKLEGVSEHPGTRPRVAPGFRTPPTSSHSSGEFAVCRPLARCTSPPSYCVPGAGR